jgi:hypothetical protein
LYREPNELKNRKIKKYLLTDETDLSFDSLHLSNKVNLQTEMGKNDFIKDDLREKKKYFPTPTLSNDFGKNFFTCRGADDTKKQLLVSDTAVSCDNIKN